jgi:hypothetical protein
MPDPTLPSHFVHEDLSRAENRINVALFGAQAIPEFWSECRGLLGLTSDAYLERVTLRETPARPDFRIIQNGIGHKWLEVELGDRDTA